MDGNLNPRQTLLAPVLLPVRTLDEAMAVCRELNSEGIAVTLDVLGESISSAGEAAAARDAYLRTLSAIHEKGIQGNVSLKLTQFGLDLSAEVCRANVAQLVEKAAAVNGFVRIDMESSEYTDRDARTGARFACQIPRGGNGDPGVSLSQ